MLYSDIKFVVKQLPSLKKFSRGEPDLDKGYIQVPSGRRGIRTNQGFVLCQAVLSCG